MGIHNPSPSKKTLLVTVTGCPENPYFWQGNHQNSALWEAPKKYNILEDFSKKYIVLGNSSLKA